MSCKLLLAYIRHAKKLGLPPSLPELRTLGFSREVVRHRYGSLEKLAEAARAHDPKAFVGILAVDVFAHERFDAIREAVKTGQRFVVTTAVTGAKVHKGFYASLQTYCRLRNAKLIVLPSMDPAALAARKSFIDPVLGGEHILVRDLRLNRNLFISSIKLSAKHIDPITGLSRIGQRDGSFIYASPKQRLKLTPTCTPGKPHALMTTGAITMPDYDSDRYMSKRTAYIAEHDHVLGAVIVEVQDDRIFHYRQVQADARGQFNDMGVLYMPEGSKLAAPGALVLGDWHAGQTSSAAKTAFLTGPRSLRGRTLPPVVVLHDLFDGISVNHHEAKDEILRAQRSAQARLALGAELQRVRDDLDYFCGLFEEVVVVRSNHDEFLDRYLRAGMYRLDPQNYDLCLMLARRLVQGETNALKAGIEHFGLLMPERVRWLKTDDDYRVGNVQLANHGHRGANGSRGSMRAMEEACGASVSGHAHTPEILRKARRVGTSTNYDMGYNSGPSSWLRTCALVYDSGAVQLINEINNEFTLKDTP